MALSILATPPAFSSFQDDCVYTVKNATAVADPITYPNYAYIADILVGATLVARVKKVPDPVTGIGIFNIAQIIRSYSAITFNPGTGLVSQVMGDKAVSLQITVHFGESYGYVDYPDVTVDGTRYFFNNYNDRLIGVTNSIGGKLDLFATNRVSPFNTDRILFSSGYYFLPFFPLSTGSYTVIVTPILANGSDGTPYTTTVTIAMAYDMQLFNASPQAINTASPGLLNSSMRGYRIKVGASAIFTIYFICESQYQPVMVHFLNQYAGFDSKLFTKVSRRAYDITKADFGKLPYTVASDGTVNYKSSNGVYNETRSTYSSQYIEKQVLNSDNLTDTEYLWLKDLLLSPMVFVEDRGYFYPVIIKDTNYEPKKFINDEMTNLTINIEFGKTLNAQYR